jgi:ankyrin repeat protein
VHIDLEQARKRAKELVRAGKAEKLAEAQLVIARELGYSSWPRLVHAVERPTAARVVDAAYGMPDRVPELLERAPALRGDPWVALTLGDASRVQDAAASGGPLDAAPIFYVCRSRVAANAAAAAGDLLARGADPNVGGPENWTCLSVACSHGDAELVRVLLEAGAEPNDNDSLYHSVEPADPSCTLLLLEHGAEVPGTNALAHALDYDRIDRVRLLLDHGADPNERAPIHHAILRGRSPEVIRLLVERGADLAHRDRHGLTAYQQAVRRGRRELAEALAALGAPTELAAADEALAAIAEGTREPAAFDLDPAARNVLIEIAMRDAATLARVVERVGPDFSACYALGPRGTLLHQAAWFGRPDYVELLLARGASVDERVETEYATPLGWAVVGSRFCVDQPDESFAASAPDHLAVAEQLVAAGARIEPKFAEIAVGPLAAWLEERTLLA